MAEKKNVNVNESLMEKSIPEEKPVETLDANGHKASKYVRRYVLWSLGAGLIPIPLVDISALAAIQLKMLHRLSKHYGVKFSKNIGKSVIAALVGSITADALRGSAANSFIKAIPIVGVVGSVSMPIYAGATTYAIGKIFIQHFESGGTFLDFDPQKVKDYFANFYKEGQKVAVDLKAETVK